MTQGPIKILMIASIYIKEYLSSIRTELTFNVVFEIPCFGLHCSDESVEKSMRAFSSVYVLPCDSQGDLTLYRGLTSGIYAMRLSRGSLRI